MRAMPGPWWAILASGCILGWDPIHDTARFEDCGDAEIQAPEDCDGDNLGNLSCNAIGYYGGTLSCDGCRFDTSECTNCGDGVVQPEEDEECDRGGALNDGGYDGCTETCTRGPYCGDGVLDEGYEACDAGDNDGAFGGCEPDCTVAPALAQSTGVQSEGLTTDVRAADGVPVLNDFDGALLLANQSAGTPSVLGQLTTLGSTFPANPDPRLVRVEARMAIGAIDPEGTGMLDLAIGSMDAGIEVYREASLEWTTDGRVLGSGNTARLALADLDGDGDLDIFEAHNPDPNSNDGQQDRFWSNRGDGSMALTPRVLPLAVTPQTSTDVALGDIDGDGHIDAIVSTTGTTCDDGRGNVIYRNDPGGEFTRDITELGFSPSFGIAMGDLDGDGDLDLAVANGGCNGGAPDIIWMNDGAGSFTATQSLGLLNSRDIALGDVDNDGDLDVFVAVICPECVAGDPARANRLWLNDGSGQFTESRATLGDADSYSLATGDLDADGDLDVFVGNDGENTIWWNNLAD